MITSKRKWQKKTAEVIAAEEAKQPAQKKPKATPTPIKELSPVPYSGRKKGIAHRLAKRARDYKFAGMKNIIVRGWANNEIWPNMTHKEWIL